MVHQHAMLITGDFRLAVYPPLPKHVTYYLFCARTRQLAACAEKEPNDQIVDASLASVARQDAQLFYFCNP